MRTPPTDEELRAAQKLKAAFKDTKHLHGLTYEKLADELGVSFGTVSHYFNGYMPINMEFLIRACSLLPTVSAMDIFPEMFQGLKLPDPNDPLSINDKFYSLPDEMQGAFLLMLENAIDKDSQ